MKKKNNVDYDKLYFTDKNLYVTKYDHLFSDVIRSRGTCYYFSNKVTNFHNDTNKISAVVKGTIDYNTSVEFLDNDEIKVKCECKYHNETDLYCKHVYALILYLKMIDDKKKMIDIYKSNCKKIKKIINENINIINDNKKYYGSSSRRDGLNLQKRYDEYLEKMNEKFDKNNDFKLMGLVRDSYSYLNDIIDNYNKTIDYIEEKKNLIEKRKEKNNKTDVTVTHLATFDDSKIFDSLDELFANVDVSILERVREDDIKNGKSTEIMDKAIAERKRRDKLIEQEQKKERKIYRGAIILGILSGLSELLGKSKSKKSSNNLDLMPHEEDLVNKNEYDTFNFEEEELEDDDYYNEDLD